MWFAYLPVCLAFKVSNEKLYIFKTLVYAGTQFFAQEKLNDDVWIWKIMPLDMLQM